jgi:hypothetical protein
MIPKSTLYSNFLVSIAAKLLFFVANGRNATESLKAYGLLLVFRKTTKPAGYSTTVVVLSCYRMLRHTQGMSD